jgi:hypothetical protein
VHRLKAQQGQAMVEFALILPILLVIILGVFDFGGAYNTKNDLNFLANQAARYAEVNSCAPCGSGSDPIATYVKTTADTNYLKDNVSICFSLPPGSSGDVGDPLQVKASAPFNWLGFFSNAGLPTGSTTLSSTVTVRILQASDGSLYTTGSC